MEDDGKWINKPNPVEKVNVFSRLFFSWTLSFFATGYKRDLEIKDLYECPQEDCSEHVGSMLQKQWDIELSLVKAGKKKKPSLRMAAFRTFGGILAFATILAVIQECGIRVLQPILLGWMVRYFSDLSLNGRLWVFSSAATLCLLCCLYVLTYHPYFFWVQRVGMKIRVACCGLMYRKALCLSHSSLGRTTVGQMVNLLSNDVNRFDWSLIFIPYIVVAPLQAVVITYVLWHYLGITTLAGLAVFTLYLPFQGVMGKWFSKLRMKTAVLTDERIRLMNEIVSGMRVIKMYTWEIPFATLVDQTRRKEVAKIRHTSMLRAVNLALFFVSSKVVIFLCFIILVVFIGEPLTSESVFVSIALFNSLRLTLTLFFPYAVAQGSESLISLKRIQRFLLLEEQEESSMVNRSNLRPKLEQCGVWLSRVTARWNREIEEPTLSNITVTVLPGMLLAVVGPVGCGKSSLLMSILGELPTTAGDVKIRGKLAYASQEPWVFAGSVKQNVIFGSPFDEAKYKKVLNVCALDKDIAQLAYGDRTHVGERGTALSGGQKARVNLARALYYDADVYLLDDPLSAVDSAVSKHLFEKCINGYLKNKVRILVTHQVQFLKSVDQILVLKQGGILALGNYDQLLNAGIDIVALMQENEEEERRQRRERTTSSISCTGSITQIVDNIVSSSASALYGSTTSINSLTEGEGAWEDVKVPKLQEETKSSGAVKGAVYTSYIKAGGGCCLFLILILTNIASQALFSGSDYWLSLWTNSEESKQRIQEEIASRNWTNETMANYSGNFLDLNTNIYVYSGLIAALFITSLLRTIIYFIMCMKASVSLHNMMFRSIARAPIAFFDSNPIGRVLNRFSRDMGTIDDLLPPTGLDMIMIFLNMAGVIVLVTFVSPWISLPTVVLAIIFTFIRRFYIPTARDVKRLEGITRSPVFSHLSTSLYGLTTIRAFRAQQTFEVAFDRYQDQHSAAYFMVLATTRWFGVVLDWLCAVYICAVTISFVLSPSDTPGGYIGLAISSALMMSGGFQWGVRQNTELESQMTCVERVLEYSNLPEEAALEAPPHKRPPPEWPERGTIVFENLYLQYVKTDPPVLKNLNCSIKPREKVGIVGRTGAGKSSVIAALFRMTEPEGIIRIDGIVTKDIGLHDLRKKISIIPQDPVLFTGPVRRNIDPFNQHTDDELWKVLEEVQLKDVVADLPAGLDTQLSEGGSNFSVGQRQLICLARAILKKNRILVLDEATANVDPTTDGLIQNTIREKFQQCTVLTIAHRLHTIMDSERVLVLDAGKIKEFGEPYTLLQDQNSQFSEMVRHTGRAMAEQLYRVAREAYLARQRKLKGPSFQNGGIEMLPDHICSAPMEPDPDSDPSDPDIPNITHL